MKILKVGIQIIGVFVLMLTLTNCGTNESKKQKEEVESLKAELSSIIKANEIITKNIKTFDELDFVIYSNQDWTRLHESHSHDVLVHYPDGHTTKGIEEHIEELKPMFVFAPDTRIEEHPIKFGSGNLTAVIGELKGAFSEPMPIGGVVSFSLQEKNLSYLWQQ